MLNQVTFKENSTTGSIVTMRTITDKKTGESREIGSVMVQSKHFTGMGSLTRVQTRTAFLSLEQDALELLEPVLVKDGVVPFQGKIIIQETLVPYVRKDGSKQEPKMNPTTNAIITYQGQPVYRNTLFSEDMNAQDVFLRDAPNVPAGASSEEAPE